jgi:beta-mannosidase
MKSADSMKLLDGYWNYIPDERNRLTYEQAGKALRNERTNKIKIPSNWERAGIHNFSGSIWFSRSFRFSSETPKLKILEFKGADYFADVWLNDIYLGGHEGYFQPFYFDVTGLLKKRGDNKIVVKVTSPFEEPGKVWPHRKKLIKGIFNHHDCRPGAWSYQYGQDQNTGGIWNSVILHSVKSIFIDNVKVTSRINYVTNKASVRFVISYYRKTTSPVKYNVELRIKTPSGKVLKTRHNIRLNGIKGEIKIIAEISNPELWWSWDLGRPNLYELNIDGKFINTGKIKFGIREVKLNEKKEFFLNGKRLFLRGTNIIPTQFLSELTREKISGQVSMMKEANINIVRMHAHVNRAEYYEECDRQGLLVWQDFALQWTYDHSRKFINNAVSQIKDMVRLFYNHPSITFWCCHNEPGDQINTLDGFLYDAVTGIDKSRIVRKASNYEEHPYDGWYWGNKEHFAARPMGPLVTEFGAQALPELKSLKKIIPQKDIYSPAKESWAYHDFQYDQTFNIAEVNRGKNIKEFINNSQEYQLILIKTAVDFYRRGKNKDITGIFQFMFIDCWPSITWSVVDYYGKKKKGYYILQEAFQPVYISLNILQKKYFTGKQLNLEIRIINDLHISFKNCVLVFKIDNKSFFKFWIKRIIKDSVSKFKKGSINIKLPETLRTGKHKIDAELTDGKKILSTNSFEIEIVRKV